MASIESRRGMPRPRPPFPAQSGLDGKPSNINNVKTLASVPVIISWGAVTSSHEDVGEPGPIQVLKYEVVVEQEDPLLIFSVELPQPEPIAPDERLAVTIPDEFINLGEEFKFEILVQTATGNRTAVESCFEVE